jgi:hypothetical protein
MRVVLTEAASKDQNAVTYRCDNCGTETQRVLKRD